MQEQDVDFFNARLNRLKLALGVTKDKEAGEALGLKEKAFNARKTRGSFPVKELRALAQTRPDLNIDVEFVLSGGPGTIGRAIEDMSYLGLVPSALQPRIGDFEARPYLPEGVSYLNRRKALLDKFDAATEEGKRTIECVASFAAGLHAVADELSIDRKKTPSL